MITTLATPLSNSLPDCDSARELISTAKSCKVKMRICDRGPSDFPEFAQFLVALSRYRRFAIAQQKLIQKQEI